MDEAADRELVEYGDRLPVVLVDGAEHSCWEVDDDELIGTSPSPNRSRGGTDGACRGPLAGAPAAAGRPVRAESYPGSSAGSGAPPSSRAAAPARTSCRNVAWRSRNAPSSSFLRRIHPVTSLLCLLALHEAQAGTTFVAV